MKAISLWQPWASAIAVGVKKIETRSWLTHYRGRLAIHATANTPRKDLDFFDRMDAVSRAAFAAAGIDRKSDLPQGFIVATCDVVDCVPQTAKFVNKLTRLEYPWGIYATGRFAWILDNVVRLQEPIYVPRGGQRLWNWKEAA